MQEIAAAPSLCPSFSTYSSDIAETAVRVRREFDDVLDASTQLRNYDEGDASFEFVSAVFDTDSPSSWLFPIFDREIFSNGDDQIQSRGMDSDEKMASVGDQLRSLFVGDEKDPQSSSEEEEEEEKEKEEEEEETAELEGVPVWSTKQPAELLPRWWRKSWSTGSSSKRWCLRDLILRRTNTDGKATPSLGFLNSLPSESVIEKRGQKTAEEKKRGKDKRSALEVFYTRNKALKEGERRKSYLPYRRDLIRIFSLI